MERQRTRLSYARRKPLQPPEGIRLAAQSSSPKASVGKVEDENPFRDGSPASPASIIAYVRARIIALILFRKVLVNAQIVQVRISVPHRLYCTSPHPEFEIVSPAEDLCLRNRQRPADHLNRHG